MGTPNDKAAYVRSQSQTRDHGCHWPGCQTQVPPAMWGCKRHWFKLPRKLRARIWATYEPGQEVDGTPSHAYLEAARAVQDWIAEQPDAPERPGTPEAGDVVRQAIVALRGEADCMNLGFKDGHHNRIADNLRRIADELERSR